MLDGLLLFAVLDVWRMLLPLGLSFLCLGSFGFQRLVGESQTTGLCPYLCILTYRLAVALAIILAVVGILIPWVLGYALPERHVADGPWSYEEIFGYGLGVVLLWRLQQQVSRQQMPSALIMAGTLILFLAVGLLWIARWDVMANLGQVPGGWFLGSAPTWEWSRLIPKCFHLIFSAFVTGGIIVAVMGLFGTLTSSDHQAEGGFSPSRPAVNVGLIRYGMGWILSGLVPQMLIGPWLFLLLQDHPQMSLIEGTTVTSLIFFLSLTAAFLALVFLNASFMAPHVKGLVWGGLGSVALTLVLMTVIRYETFVATVHSHGIPLAIGVITGWQVVSVFLLVGLLYAILMRWCVWPSALIYASTLPTSSLDNT